MSNSYREWDLAQLVNLVRRALSSMLYCGSAASDFMYVTVDMPVSAAPQLLIQVEPLVLKEHKFLPGAGAYMDFNKFSGWLFTNHMAIMRHDLWVRDNTTALKMCTHDGVMFCIYIKRVKYVNSIEHNWLLSWVPQYTERLQRTKHRTVIANEQLAMRLWRSSQTDDSQDVRDIAITET